MPFLIRACALAVLALLAACGQKHDPSGTVTDKGRQPHPIARAQDEPPVARPAEALAKVDAPAAGETVGDSSFSFSPIARAVAASTPAPAPAIPARWAEGKNYNLLVPIQPTASAPDKVEVLEVFWYGCPHCFHLDPFLEAWRTKGKPAFADFSRMPVIWPGNEVNRMHARLFYTLEALGKLPELHAEVFREIHVNGNPLVDPRDPAHTEQLQKAFLVAHGVSAADFDRTYKSFSVESKLQHAEQYTLRYKVVGVPMVVVGGKYTADVGTAGGENDLLTLMTDLATAERRH